jgi:hypothetical protein
VYRLAYHFKKLPSEILSMSRREFNQCLAFLQIEPPEEPANTRTANLMAQIANFAGKSLKQGKHLSADDYLGKPEIQQTATEQIAFMESIEGSK